MIPAVTSQKGILRPLNQATRGWHALCPTPNGDWYAANYGGMIYRQTGGLGSFATIPGLTDTKNWRDMTSSPDGSFLLLAADDGEVYKLTLSTMTLQAQSAGLGSGLRGISITPGGDWYAAIAGAGAIMIRTGGAGSWADTSAPVVSYGKVECCGSGHVYAIADAALYKRTDGAGAWAKMFDLDAGNYGIGSIARGNGDELYWCMTSGKIYKLAATGGSPVEVVSDGRGYRRIQVGASGNLYASVYNGDIYKTINGF